MKSYNNLYESIISYSNLDRALDRTLRGKKKNGIAAKYNLYREKNLKDLEYRLRNKTWESGTPRTFRVYEPKQRDIQAPPFEDRIVHHAIDEVINNLFDKKFIYHSYACRKGKGTQKAVMALQKMIKYKCKRNVNPYCVQIDISKYFKSIDHDILLEIINKTIKCKDTIDILEKIIRNYDNVGLPVGSLTSQLLANLYLNEVDQYITNSIGYGKYIRYMDDIIILTKNKKEAIYIMKIIEEKILSIKLKVNPKSNIFPIYRGIDYVGYRVFLTHILPRKSIIKRFKKLLNKIRYKFSVGLIDLSYVQKRVNSLIAYIKHCRAKTTLTEILLNFKLTKGLNHDFK